MHHATCIAAVLLLLGSLPSNAGTVVFSNLGPEDSYGPDGISFGANPFLPPSSSTGIVATRFQVSVDSLLDRVETSIGVISGPVDFTAYLLSERDGLPDQAFAAVHITDLASVPSGPMGTSIDFAPQLLLSGTPYWFGLSAGADTFASWLFTIFQGVPTGSSHFAIGAISGNTTSNWNVGTGGPLGREGAFRVLADPVPEPVSWSLLLAGSIALLAARSFCARTRPAAR